jgi:hypothetical protein
MKVIRRRSATCREAFNEEGISSATNFFEQFSEYCRLRLQFSLATYSIIWSLIEKEKIPRFQGV